MTSFLFESIWCFVLVCGLGVLTLKKPIESLPRIKQGLNFSFFLCGAGDSDVLPRPKEPSDVLLLPFLNHLMGWIFQNVWPNSNISNLDLPEIKVFPLLNHYLLGVRSCEVAIIWPENVGHFGSRFIFHSQKNTHTSMSSAKECPQSIARTQSQILSGASCTLVQEEICSHTNQYLHI